MRHLALFSIATFVLTACAEDAPTPRPPRTDGGTDIGSFDAEDVALDTEPDLAEDALDTAPDDDAEPDAEPDVQEDPDTAPDLPDAEPDIDVAPDLPPPALDWCRLQSPSRFEAAVGETFIALGRVRAPGITDRTESTDADASLQGEVGIGAPDDAISDWTWTAADTDNSWTDPTSMADQYLAEVQVPGTGEFRIAYRFRRDGGDWTLCDLSRGAGRDGSEDGFAAEDAGIVHGLGPCDLNDVCGSAPLPGCTDGDTLRTYESGPTCEVIDGDAWCTFVPTETTCPARTECAAGACVSDSVAIDWCRLDAPSALELAPEAPFSALVSLRATGLTDRTTSVDIDERLTVDLGIGPNGSDVDSGAWRWTVGAADSEWRDVDGVDQWGANLSGVGVGTWKVAARVSGDRGDTYLYCDLDVAEGSDGTEDGFAIEDAGVLEVFIRVDPCSPNPCVGEPTERCDGDVLVAADISGACSVSGDAAECAYGEFVVEDCGGAGFRCEDARCVSDVRAPSAGELVVSEIMPVTDGDVWFELTNVGDSTVNLDGCSFLGSGGSSDIARPLLIDPGQRFVIASGGDTVAADFIVPAFTPGEAGFVFLSCEGTTIDSMSWEADQITANTAHQLDVDSVDAVENDLSIRWCRATSTYAEGYLGSPGAANGGCVPPSVPIDWCRLQWPHTISGNVGATENVYGRVYGEGVTDVTAGTDENGLVLAQAGYGPDGSDPDSGWTWFDAIPNSGWDDELEVGNDEYEAVIRMNEPGEFDVAFRFSGDLGATWTLCDLEAASDGSEDGYSPADSGVLSVAPAVDPCDPNPCVVAPSPSCDGDTSHVVSDAGECTNFGGAVCEYTADTTACEPGLCVDGVCQLAPAIDPPWCRLQWPSSMTLEAGASGDVYARLFASGVTGASRGVDRYPALIGEIGVGPVGVDPADSSLAFEWFEMSANTSYDDVAAGEPNNDEYEVSISVDAAGAYSYVARFTGDSGSTWVYCDMGPSGSADGFSPANAGSLTVTSAE